jgi:hypothetical protein
LLEVVLFDEILRGLRQRVQALEEDEIFQQTLMRGSQVGKEPLPSADNIDTLIQDMMGSSIKHVSDGPWNRPNVAEETSSSMRTAGTGQQRLGQY